MNLIKHDVSKRQAALVAGIGFLLSFGGAIFSGGFVNGLIVPGDAVSTSNNLTASAGLFRVGIVSWLIVILGDIVRAWAVYVFFRDVNRSIALLSAWLMLIHDAIFGSALMNLILISVISSGNSILTGFGVPESQGLLLLLFDGFNAGFELGLFFFSFHLALLGYLVLKSGFIPKIFSILLFIAAIGYLMDSVGKLFPAYPEILWTIFMGPCLIGEMAIMIWLFLKGGKNETVS